MNRLINWPLACCVLGAVLSGPASAAIDLYENSAEVSYPGTLAYPPVIDATNFVNTESGRFTINFTVISSAIEFFETFDTVNYTNVGTMVANTGFSFATRTTNTIPRVMAGNFYNSGKINCATTDNTSSPYYIFGLYGYSLYSGYGYAQFVASATNVVNSGKVNVGVGGLVQFNGENVDLTRGRLTVEGFNQFANQGVFGSAAGFGTDTNQDWTPASDLTPTSAGSSWPRYLNLTNTIAYVETNSVGSNSVIIRSVFLYNPSVNVTNDVYLNASYLGTSAAMIEWRGFYLDSATGSYETNYMYLYNNYVLASTTNVTYSVYNVPSNFQFIQSRTSLQTALGTPAVAGFPNGFFFEPSGGVTNTYSYVDALISASTVDLTAVPTHSITNMPGRIEINANKQLDLSLVEISGANYLSLKSTNQYNGNEGAYISVPYADINVGVTNGFLRLTNILQAAIPNWSGTIQAWSGRYLNVDANNITNDYRVLIVGSYLNPVAPAKVQDLQVHATNTLVVSDTFNVTRNFKADAQNLILTTNATGVGAGSVDGELNLTSPSIFWANSLPNLRNLTNGGAIRTLNLANFGSPLSYTVTQSVAGVAATSILAKANASVTNVKQGDKLYIGSDRYVFLTKLTNSVVGQVLIGTTFDGSMSNLIAAINHDSGAGTKYSSSTLTNVSVTAGTLQSSAFTLSARDTGTAGNSIALTIGSTNITCSNGKVVGGVGYGTLAGGVNAVIGSTNLVAFPYDNFVNRGVVSDQGASIYSANFVSSGTFTNGNGGFNLISLTTTLTNGLLAAGGDVTIGANSLVTSNLVLQAGHSLTLWATNLLTDTGVTNQNNWTVGALSSGYGIRVPIMPLVAGDLLGTTITNIAPTNTSTLNIWAGVDYGLTPAGYTNNLAVGRLILNPVSSTIKGHNGAFVFKGAGQCPSNALYVDYLELDGFAATNEGLISPYDFAGWLTIQTNLTIYFAQAMQNGQSVAQKIDDASRLQGANGGRLRWIPKYNGYYSSTNFVYPPGVTNVLNTAALAVIDSDGDGKPNAYDDSPFFLSSQVNFTMGLTNLPPMSVRVQWATTPNATNYIYYTTNLTGGTWLPFTNFEKYYCANGLVRTNTALTNCFVSPQPWQAMGSPATNVWVFDVVTNMPHYYRVLVQPALNYPY